MMYEVTAIYKICGKEHECLATEPATRTHKNIAVFFAKEDAEIKIKELADLGIKANCSQFDKAWFMD